jgi:hypothetical protein
VLKGTLRCGSLRLQCQQHHSEQAVMDTDGMQKLTQGHASDSQSCGGFRGWCVQAVGIVCGSLLQHC